MTGILKKTVLTLCAGLLLGGAAQAQFYPTGSNPARLRWQQVRPPHFQVVFPAGSDSLARVYARELERWRPVAGLSCGMLSGDVFKGRLPVILHGCTATANGSVSWAPRRMDLYTMPDPVAPTPIPWARLLAIHEGRHAAQMQFGGKGVWKPWRILFGEMPAGALAGVFPGPVLLEGDAVVAETALTRSGRGRQADFLVDLMPAFDVGDFRDFYQWCYGSQQSYAPDYYRAGYLLVAGMRVFFDDPLFTARYFDKVSRKPGFRSLQKTVQAAADTSFRAAFRQIERRFADLWREEAAARGPFMPGRQVSPTGRLYNRYGTAAQAADGTLFVAKSGLSRPTTLVALTPHGKESSLRPFSTAGPLYTDPDRRRIYWTEITPGLRWTLQQDARIRYIDTDRPRRIHTLTRRGRFFGSAPSQDGTTLLTTEYPGQGGSALCLLRASDGTVLTRMAAPDSLQFTQAAWLGGRIFTAGLSDNGSGIYEVTGRDDSGKARLRKVAGPAPVVIEQLEAAGGCLTFLCDRTGVSELYRLDPDSGELVQLTNTRYGVYGPRLNAAGDSLYYTAVAASDDPSTFRRGRMLFVTAVADLPVRTVSFDDIHPYSVADALSAQEARLGAGTVPPEDDVFLPATPFRKLGRLPHVHSWAPVYFNYDNVEAFTFDEYYKTASPGATVLFQHLLGTGYGSAGYSFHPDPGTDGKWRHSAHLQYTWTGWFPVLEVSADCGERARADITRILLTKEDGQAAYGTSRAERSGPYLYGELKAYVPLNFSSGGWRRGIVPQVRYGIGNNRYDDDVVRMSETKDPEGKPVRKEDGRIDVGGRSVLRNLTASVRGYATTGTAPSQVFPRWGGGVEAGYHLRPGHTAAFTPAAYGYIYAYAPGLLDTHGWRLTATVQRQWGGKGWCLGENAVQTRPRGMTDSALGELLGRLGERQAKLTVDYAMPVRFPFRGSLLSPAAYIRRIEVVPFADVTFVRFRDDLIGRSTLPDCRATFASAGADIVLHLSNFLWLPYDTSAGIRLGRNFRSDGFAGKVAGLERPFFAGFLFSVDL